MRTTRSAITRLEGFSGHRPSFATLERYPPLVECALVVTLRRIPFEWESGAPIELPRLGDRRLDARMIAREIDRRTRSRRLVGWRASRRACACRRLPTR
jgi:hypothetical protein